MGGGREGEREESERWREGGTEGERTTGRRVPRRQERRCSGIKEAGWREKERRRGLTARETNVREKKGGHEGGKRLERWSRTDRVRAMTFHCFQSLKEQQLCHKPTG